jgi:hypothetical protein
MLGAIIASERRTHGVHRGFTAHIAIGGQCRRVVLAGDDGPHDLHSGHPSDICHHMMQLQVHLHECFLHVLDVRRRLLQQALALTEVRAERRPCLGWVEAPPQ